MESESDKMLEFFSNTYDSPNRISRTHFLIFKNLITSKKHGTKTTSFTQQNFDYFTKKN